MSILCKLFGHRRYSGWYGDGLYGKVKFHAIDNLGTTHYTVNGDCDRCGENYILARFHGHSVDRATPEHLKENNHV